MKKVMALFAVFLLCFTIKAQEYDDDFKTIFDGEDFRISGFGGPFMSFTSVSGEFAHMMGGGGGVMLGDFFFGGYGLGLTNSIRDKNNPDERGRHLEFGHGGLWTGFSIKSRAAIHPSFHTQIGWGSVSINDDFIMHEEDNVFVLTPTLEVELNLTRFLRLSIGGSYRYVSNVDLSGYDNEDLAGPSAFLGFKFGWF